MHLCFRFSKNWDDNARRHSFGYNNNKIIMKLLLLFIILGTSNLQRITTGWVLIYLPTHWKCTVTLNSRWMNLWSSFKWKIIALAVLAFLVNITSVRLFSMIMFNYFWYLEFSEFSGLEGPNQQESSGSLRNQFLKSGYEKAISADDKSSKVDSDVDGK